MTSVDYTAKDYLSLREQMVATAQERLPEWSPTSDADFALAIIESVAYVGDLLAYYADRVLNEAFLPTAQQRSSVVDIARMLGYEPGGPVPASVDVTFGVDASTSDVTIPAGTRVSTESVGSSAAVVFETVAEAVVSQGGGSSIAVTATQGETVADEVLGTATNEANQQFSLANSPVPTDSVLVDVDEGNGFQRWVRYDYLLDADPNTPAFSTTRDADGLVTIRFGDDVDGRIPAQGATIRATYRIGGGPDGNVPIGAVRILLDAVPGVLSVQNLISGSGGEASESIEEIRANAPVATRTGDRAVTLRDFRDLASVVPGVAHASAESDNATSVLVYVAPKGPDQPALSAGLQTAVQTALADRALLGTSTTVLGATYVPVDVTMNVVVDDSFSQPTVTTQVEAAVDALFALENVEFGKTLALSDVYRTVAMVPGVLYLTVTQHERDYTDPDAFVVTDQIAHSVSELPYLNSATVNPSGGIIVT